MNENSKSVKFEPPRLLGSLMAGFNSVANHAWVIFLPIILDLLLWFTPRLRIDQLFLPMLEKALAQSQQISGTDIETMSVVGDYFRKILENFNLSGAIRSYPIGVPSLMAGVGTSQTPLGEIQVIQVGSGGIAVLLLAGLLFLGLILGGLFFNQIVGIAREPKTPKLERPIFWKIGQTFILTVGLILIALIVLIPGMLIISLLTLISPLLGQLSFFLYLFLIFWFIVPWFYAYHGIFIFGLNAFRSALLSLQVGQFFIANTATLIMLILLISQGLNLLWLTPPTSSWFILLGIAGHAIVSAGLFSTSVIYYQQINKALAILVSIRQRNSKPI